jgi:hypothetical protein
MAEKKQILLEVTAKMSDAVKEIANLNHAIADLRAEEYKLGQQMEQMAKEGLTNTEAYRALEQQLVVNRETQKAYRKEIQSQSHEIQNSIIAEGKYAETLKGKSALLANEKKILRELKVANGELSEEYKAQEKKVADLNAEILELEKAYGTYGRNVGNYESAWGGMLNKLKIGWAAFIALTIKGIKEFGEDFVNMTQKTGDRWRFEVAGWKDAYAAFIVSLQRGDGWNELIDNITSAYSAGKDFARMLDEIFERENSLRIEEAAISAENEQLRIDMRDRTKSDEERIAAAKKYLENEQNLAAMRQDIANQERDANKGRLQERTKMTDAELDFYVKEYNANKDIIRQAIAYNKELKEQQQIIDASQRSRKLARVANSDKGAEGATTTLIDEAETQARARIAELQAEASEGLKRTAEIAAKYSLTNDELVTAYVESEIKAQTVTSNMLQHTARAQTQMHTLEAELTADKERAAEKAAQEREKETERERKRTEDALKAQEKALTGYVATVGAIYDQLADAQLNTTEKAVKGVKRQYQEQSQALAQQVRSGMMSYEEYMYLRVALAQQASKDIKAIEDAARDEAEQAQKEQLSNEARARKEQLTADLQIAWQNADEQFRIKKEYLERELEIAGLTADKKAELEQQLTELIRTHMEDRVKMTMDYAGKLEQAFTSINTIATNKGKERIQEAEAENEAEKESLDKRLKAGMVSQAQYDKQVEKLDADLAKKKAVETRKQAERDKALALYQAAVNTATALVKVWADVPTLMAPAFATIVASVGALQMAAIASEPLPKARKGGRIEGAKHEQGGVLVETEGDERIVAAKPSKAFPELLNLISYIGKNAAVPDSGFAQRYYTRMAQAQPTPTVVEIDYDRLASSVGQQVVDALRTLNLTISLREFREEENIIARMDELTKQ